MGSTLSAIIRIRNLTTSDITSVLVYDIDTFDFGNCRPDRAFSGMSIPAKGCVEKTLDFSAISSYCPFTTKLGFQDGTEDVFRINYKCIFDDNEANLRHLTKSHKLEFKKTGPRVLEIIIENTEEQIQNQKAQQLINDGCKLMAIGKFNEASVKFMEAAEKANERKTILNLQQQSQKLKNVKEKVDVDKKAKTLNNEGLQLLQNFKLQEALKKFEEGLRLAKNVDTITLIEDNLKITKDAKSNQEAKKLNQEGLLLRHANQNAAAVCKFDEALRIANDRNLIKTIKRNKTDTLNMEGKEVLQNAWLVEVTSSEEAIHEFAKAKFLFQQSESVKPNLECQQCIALIDCKVEGDIYYNAGVQFENEGSRLIDKTVKSESSRDCKVAKRKYKEAWKQYMEALKKFEEGKMRGDINFVRSIRLTGDALRGIERIINELEKAEKDITKVTS